MAKNNNNKKRSADDMIRPHDFTDMVQVSKIFCKDHENVAFRVLARFSDSQRDENMDLKVRNCTR